MSEQKTIKPEEMPCHDQGVCRYEYTRPITSISEGAIVELKKLSKETEELKAHLADTSEALVTALKGSKNIAARLSELEEVLWLAVRHEDTGNDMCNPHWVLRAKEILGGIDE